MTHFRTCYTFQTRKEGKSHAKCSMKARFDKNSFILLQINKILFKNTKLSIRHKSLAYNRTTTTKKKRKPKPKCSRK